MVTIECKYCSGKPLIGREPLMISYSSDYKVFINSCNYLEDSVIGNSVPHSLHGVKINFCPMCGIALPDKIDDAEELYERLGEMMLKLQRIENDLLFEKPVKREDIILARIAVSDAYRYLEREIEE